MMCQDEIERGSRIQKVQEVQGVQGIQGIQLFHGVGIGIAIGIGIVFHLAFDTDTDTVPEKNILLGEFNNILSLFTSIGSRHRWRQGCFWGFMSGKSRFS